MISKTDWQVDQVGRLCNYSVHDAHLAELAISEKEKVVLLLEGGSKVRTRIVLSKIHELNVTVYNGITVSNVYIWPVNAVPSATWSVPDQAWNSLFAGPYGSKEPRRESERIASMKPESFLFQLDSAYGGGIVAVCDSISISEDALETAQQPG